MKKLLLTLLFILSASSLSLNIYAAKSLKSGGSIDQVSYNKLDITVASVPYKLSNTVKVYGFGGNKFLNVKKLTSGMYIDYKYSTRKGVSTISEIWVQPN